jgi:hypothetical protein
MNFLMMQSLIKLTFGDDLLTAEIYKDRKYQSGNPMLKAQIPLGMAPITNSIRQLYDSIFPTLLTQPSVKDDEHVHPRFLISNEDQSIELLDVDIRQLSSFFEASKKLQRFIPRLCEEGENGTFFLLDENSGKEIAVFKPDEQKPESFDKILFVPKGIKEGEASVREVIAYRLDLDGFYGVPPTIMTKVSHPSFDVPKTGSLQEFIVSECASWDIGPSSFPVPEVHKLAILDLRIFNCDRHGGNILLQKDLNDNWILIPIDNGYSLPDEVIGDIWFEWLNWKQSKQPFPQSFLNHIEGIDIDADVKLLKQMHVRLACIRTMIISTLLLKKSAKFGLTPYEIGMLVCRKKPKEPSILENIVSRYELEKDTDEGLRTVEGIESFKSRVLSCLDGWFNGQKTN